MPVPVNISDRSVSEALRALWPVVLLAVLGCRSFPSQQPVGGPLPAPAPTFSADSAFSSQPPPLILGNTGPTAFSPTLPPASPPTEDPLRAFQPLVPDHLAAERVVPAAPLPTPDATASTIDELTRRVTELERSLAEKEEMLRQAEADTRRTTSDVLAAETPFDFDTPAPLPAVATTTERPTSDESIVPKALPVLGIPGVAVSSDRDRVRIEMPDTLLFTEGTWQLNPEAEKTLRKIVGEIRANWPDATLDVEGHTDCLVTDPKNRTQKHDISSYKAMVVMQYFVKTLLWDAAKITTSGHGPARPIADNGTPEGRARNNRIEIVVRPDGV